MNELISRGDIIYPIKKSTAYNMTQLNKLIKAEVISINSNGKIALIRIIALKEPINPNKDGSPINSMLANAYSVDLSTTLKEGSEIEVFIKDFYKRKNSTISEHSKYGLFFYLQVLQNSI